MAVIRGIIPAAHLERATLALLGKPADFHDHVFGDVDWYACRSLPFSGWQAKVRAALEALGFKIEGDA